MSSHLWSSIPVRLASGQLSLSTKCEAEPREGRRTCHISLREISTVKAPGSGLPLDSCWVPPPPPRSSQNPPITLPDPCGSCLRLLHRHPSRRVPPRQPPNLSRDFPQIAPEPARPVPRTTSAAVSVLWRISMDGGAAGGVPVLLVGGAVATGSAGVGVLASQVGQGGCEPRMGGGAVPSSCSLPVVAEVVGTVGNPRGTGRAGRGFSKPCGKVARVGVRRASFPQGGSFHSP